MQYILVFAVAIVLNACGPSSNVNQLFVAKQQEDTLEYLLDRAQRSYDEGEFSDALGYIQSADEISPANEQVAVLYGYVNLALVGMDSFGIARAMIDATAKQKTGTSLAASNQGAAIFLTTLRDHLGLSEDDLKEFGTYSTDDNLSAFRSYPVIVPSNASAARAAGIEALARINSTIEKICPFVDEDLRLKAVDSRHSDEHCKATTLTRSRNVVSHFLWAFSHILEASVFYSVIQYQQSGQTKPNLQLRADALESKKNSLSVTQYALHAVSLASTVTQVLDFTNRDSQFTAVSTDITTAGLAFARIGKVPKKVQSSLDKALESLKVVNSATTTATTSENDEKLKQLKSQLNSTMASQVSTKIHSLATSNPAEFQANKTDLCSAYSVISGGTTTPTACN